MPGPRDVDVSGPLAMDFIRKLTLSVLALLTIVVSFLVFYMITYVQEQRLLTECYRQTFNELNGALVVTSGAAARDRRGLQVLLDTTTNPELTREERTAAFETYRRVLATSEAERATSPIRPPREC